MWILHDRRFNRYQSTAAEEFLRHFPHYFTNVNGEGKGIFYDQYALMDRGRRIRRTSRFSIHPKDIIRAPFTSPVFQERHKWPIRFQGDACHQVSTDSDLQTPPSHPRKKGLFNFMRSLIHVLLEDIAE